MHDFARSFIDMFGNSGVEALTKEANKRLNAHDPATAIGEVFYGLPKDAAILGKQVTGSSWVQTAQGDFGDDHQICLVSSTDIPEKLENHLVWFYSKIDPDVVLRNKYDSDHGDFVGVRFKIVRFGKIFTFHQRKLVDRSVVYECELDENNNDQITWEEFWDIQHKLGQQALCELVAEFPFASKYEGIR